MRLRIVHQTHYAYETPPASIIELLRLTPRNSANQSVREWGLELSTESTMRRFDDAFGNINHTFSATGPLDAFWVRAEGTVETEPGNGVLSGTMEPLPTAVFLRHTDLTDHSAAINALAGEAARAGDSTPLGFLHALMDAVHRAMTLQPGFAKVAMPADATLSAGEGVCHDLAHIFVAAARAQRVPARFVSGYMVHEGQSRDPNATHSWAEAYVPDLGWVGFDASMNRSPDEAYVRVSVGLDSLGAAPVRGASYGGTGETLSVTVEVTNTSSATPPSPFGSSQSQSQRSI